MSAGADRTLDVRELPITLLLRERNAALDAPNRVEVLIEPRAISGSSSP